MTCAICGKPLVNIEHGNSRYFTYVCVNENCLEYGKAQIHQDTLHPEPETKRD